MNKHQEFSNSVKRANYVASVLLKLQKLYEEEEARLIKVYEEEEARLIKESLDPVPSCFKTLEKKASSYNLDFQLRNITSKFLRCSKRLDIKKQKSYGKVFPTSVSDWISLEGLHRNKVIRRAFNLPRFRLLLFNGFDQNSITLFFLAVIALILIILPMVFIYGITLWLEFIIQSIILLIGIFWPLLPHLIISIFPNCDEINIKKAHQLKLPALRQTFLELQALKLDPCVKLEYYEGTNEIHISLCVRYTREFEDLFKGI